MEYIITLLLHCYMHPSLSISVHLNSGTSFPMAAAGLSKRGSSFSAFFEIAWQFRQANTKKQVAVYLLTTESSADVLQFKIAANQTATLSQTRHSSRRSAQRPGQPTLHSPPDTLGVRGRDIIAALANVDFQRTKKQLFYAAPLKGMDAELQHADAL